MPSCMHNQKQACKLDCNYLACLHMVKSKLADLTVIMWHAYLFGTYIPILKIQFLEATGHKSSEAF